MSTTIRIAIGETSPILRSGLEVQLKRLAKYKVQITQIAEDARREWSDVIALASADIYILNPMLFGLTPRQMVSSASEDAKFVALIYGATDEHLLKSYDGLLPITCSVKQLGELFDRLIQPSEPTLPSGSEANVLTPREREIVVCIVKGMTNKEIAKTLFLSTHTVITHRRNITKKLQIHSSSGLTIYAIMNKMVELEDIKH